MNKAESEYDSRIRECKILVEKWSGVSSEDLPRVIHPDEGRVNVLEGIEDARRQMLVAQLLENVRYHRGDMGILAPAACSAGA